MADKFNNTERKRVLKKRNHVHKKHEIRIAAKLKAEKEENILRRKELEDTLLFIHKGVLQVAEYPRPGEPRRTSDGYPTEFSYDEFSYKRMLDSIRKALKDILISSEVTKILNLPEIEPYETPE